MRRLWSAQKQSGERPEHCQFSLKKGENDPNPGGTVAMSEEGTGKGAPCSVTLTSEACKYLT